MPLANQQLQLPFTGGIDQGQAPEYLDPATRLLALSNGRYAHDGGVETRFGVQALPTTVPGNYPQIGTPLACFTRKSALLATDGDGLYAYTPSLAAWTNVGGPADTNPGNPGLPLLAGTIPQCTATRASLQAFTALTAAPAACAYAEGSGVGLLAYQAIGAGGAVGSTSAILFDLVSGALISNNAFGVGPTAYNPIPIIIGGYAYVFSSDGSGNIWYQQVNLSTQAFAQGKLVTDAANQVFDATPETNGSGQPSGIVVAYNQTGNAGRVRYLRLEALPALTISSSGYTPFRSSGGSGDGPADVIACRSDYQLGVTFFAWEFATGGGSPVNYLLVAAYNAPSWTQILLGGVSTAFQPSVPGYTQGGTAFAGQICIEPLNATQFYINCFWGGYPTNSSTPIGQAVYNNAAGSQASSNQYPNVWIAGRPFRATVAGVTRLYLPVASYEPIQSGASSFLFCTVHLMDTRAYEGNNFQPPSQGYPRIVASCANRQASQVFYGTTMQNNTWRPPMLTGIGNPLAGTYKLPIGLLPSEEWQTTAAQPQPVVMQLASFNFARTFSYAEAAGETFMAGGVPSVYPGQGLTELGFHLWPSRVSGSQTTGGSLTLTATYGYALVFAEVDAAGLIHRSAPYLTSFTLTAGNDAVVWTIPILQYSQRTNAVIEVYRTQANLSTYYYEGNITAFANASITGTVTYTSTLADTAIASNATLYTTGGVLSSLAPPSLRHIIRHVDRLWGIDDTGLVIYYSTPFSTSDAPWFNDALTLQFTDETLVALASMDDKLIVFSGAHIWYVEGQGPTNLGLQSDLTTAVLIPSDVGCADWRSVVSFPGGVIFQAPSGGIYLLGRDLSVSYIGLGIQDTITNGVSVVSATLVPRTHDIRLVLSTGAVVTYDYVRGRWATLGYPNSGTFTSAIVDNAGNWTACSSGGNVWQEKGASAAAPWLDTNAAGTSFWVTLSVTSAHVKLAQLQGYQRLRHLLGYATFLEKCDITVTVNFDYGAYSQGPVTISYAKLSAANPVAAQWDMHAMATAGQAMACQVTMSTAPPSGGASYVTGQACRLLGLAFDVQILAGTSRKVPPIVKV